MSLVGRLHDTKESGYSGGNYSWGECDCIECDRWDCSCVAGGIGSCSCNECDCEYPGKVPTYTFSDGAGHD